MCTSFIFAVAINLGKSPFRNHRYSMIWTFLFTYLLLYLPSFNCYFWLYIRNGSSIEIQVSTVSAAIWYWFTCISILSTRPFLTFFCTYLLLIAIFNYTSAREASIEIQVSTVSVAIEISIYRISIYQQDRILPSIYLPSFNRYFWLYIRDGTSIEIQVSTVSVAIWYRLTSSQYINTTVSNLLFTYLLLIAFFHYTSAREASIEI